VSAAISVKNKKSVDGRHKAGHDDIGWDDTSSHERRRTSPIGFFLGHPL
jgi:hypothetical protein